MLVHAELQQQTIPRYVSSCGIYSGNLVSLFREPAKSQERKSPSFSVIAMCLTGIISPETTCGTSAIEMQIWQKERHYKGGKHQHISHIKSGGLEDCVILQVSNCARSWGAAMWSKAVRKKKKKKHLLSVFFFRQNSWCISIIAFGDKQREGWMNQKQQKIKGRRRLGQREMEIYRSGQSCVQLLQNIWHRFHVLPNTTITWTVLLLTLFIRLQL